MLATSVTAGAPASARSFFDSRVRVRESELVVGKVSETIMGISVA